MRGTVRFDFKAKKPNRIETEPGPLLNVIPYEVDIVEDIKIATT